MIFYACILLYRGQIDRVPFEYYQCRSKDQVCEVIVRPGQAPIVACH